MPDFESLGQVVNQVNESHLFGKPINPSGALQISRFIAARQGLPGSYAGLFAPTESESGKPYKLFTGEVLSTSASSRHILGEECLRILRVLAADDAAVKQATQRAQENFLRQLELTEKKGYATHTYCCGKCTIAYWRTLLTGWLPDWEEKITTGISDLTRSRQAGKWRRYPFYYTLQCLYEMPIDLARPEIQYIQPACEKTLQQLQANRPFFRQRQMILTHILEVA